MEEIKKEQAKSPIEIKNVDLNRDGKPEFIVSCFCSLGQQTFVFRRTANGLEVIFDGGPRTGIMPLKSYTNGWRNLRYVMVNSISGEALNQTLRFNGTEYK
jgi:hypothetical protein